LLSRYEFESVVISHAVCDLPYYHSPIYIVSLNPGEARFSAHPDRPWSPPSLLYNEYRVFPGGKVRLGHAADCSPPSSAVVMEE